jgi:hypothetical protein
MSQTRTSLPNDEPAPFPDPRGHRKRSARQIRHESKVFLNPSRLDEDVLEDEACPLPAHDVGRHHSPKPPKGPKPGRRGGFKVWKTPFWKRRTALRSARNATARELAEGLWRPEPLSPEL